MAALIIVPLGLILTAYFSYKANKCFRSSERAEFRKEMGYGSFGEGCGTHIMGIIYSILAVLSFFGMLGLGDYFK